MGLLTVYLNHLPALLLLVILLILIFIIIQTYLKPLLPIMQIEGEIFLITHLYNNMEDNNVILEKEKLREWFEKEQAVRLESMNKSIYYYNSLFSEYTDKLSEIDANYIKQTQE